GKIELAEDEAMRLREGDEQDADAEHEPGFVGVPERPDGGDHQVLLRIGGAVHEHPHAEVVAVADDVDEHRHAHECHEDDRQQRVEAHHVHAALPIGSTGEVIAPAGVADRSTASICRSSSGFSAMYFSTLT